MVELRQLISDVGLSDRVHLMPDLPHGEAMALLSKARLLVLPSRREPFAWFCSRRVPLAFRLSSPTFAERHACCLPGSFERCLQMIR